MDRHGKYNTSILFMTALFLLAAPSCGRLTVVEEKERVIRSVHSAPLKADQIFDRSLEWLARNLPSRSDSIEVKDRERKRIVARGTGKYAEYFNLLVNRQFTYTVVVEAKDGRYRVSYENLAVYYEEREIKTSPARFKFEMDKIRKKVAVLTDSMHDFILKGSEEWKPEKEKQEEGDDW